MRQFFVLLAVTFVCGACASPSTAARREPRLDIVSVSEEEIRAYIGEGAAKPRTLALVDERFIGRIEVPLPERNGWEFDDNDEDHPEQIVLKNVILNAEIAVQPYSTDEAKTPEERLADVKDLIERSALAVAPIRTNRVGTVAYMDYVEENGDKLVFKKIALVTFADLPNLFVHVQGECRPDDGEELNRDYEALVENISAEAF